MPVKISFILPCYNVERYIADCLDSIFAQELAESEYEVICVNDCSTDDTRNKISAYLPCHSNIYLIDHTENRTAGGARNTGIEHANGEYIWFVDPDDMIKKNVCSCLLQKVSDYNADILMFNNDTIDETGRNLGEESVFIDSECKTGQRYIETYFPMHMSTLCIIWRCIFSRRFLLQYGLRYPQIRKSQDVVFLWKSLLCANRVASVSDCCYIYRCNPFSVAKKTLQAKVAFSERILFGYEICQLLHNANIAPILFEDMRKTLDWCANGNMELLSKMPRHELILYYEEIKIKKEAVSVVRQYMTRKWRWMYANNWTCGMWLAKVAILSFYSTMKK